jgi:hypothetical protein
MKKLIRKGVFETNSSSSHSISVATEDKQFVLDILYPDQNGVVTINGDEYGWEWFKHNDAETKASYAAQSFANDDNQLDMLKEVIMEQTGADDVVFVGLQDGYVDHDSYGIVPRTKHELKNFIFNKNSWLFGGNDNSIASPEFYHVPEFRDGKIIKPVFKYELKVEGFNGTSKFIDKPTDEELSDAISSLIDGAFVTENGTFIVDNSIMWQITRPRGQYYEMGWMIDQDYSTGEIRFLREDDQTYRTINDKFNNEGRFEGLDWGQRNKMITEEVMKVPGVVVKVKFTLEEL